MVENKDKEKNKTAIYPVKACKTPILVERVLHSLSLSFRYWQLLERISSTTFSSNLLTQSLPLNC